MKEIGEFLKSSRINNGVSIEEAAEDLNFSVTQLENIEDGNIRAFKDVFALRELVKEYGKYLGVETDSIVDEFNDFMFGYTSRIPIEDILEQTKEINLKELKNEENKIVSPYTIKRKDNSTKYTILYIAAIVVLIMLVIIIIKYITDKDANKLNYNNYITERSII